MSEAESAAATKREWRVVVRSVGSAGAGIVGALRRALPWPEEQLAARLYQAPSELMRALDHATAENVSAILREAGLETEVLRQDHPFEPGEPGYDVALAIKDLSRVIDVVREIALILGVGFEQAQRIAYASPAELIGKVSANTVEALRRRLEPLGVELDVSRVADTLYDVFWDPCPAEQRGRVEQKLREAGFADCAGPHWSNPAPVCSGLRKAEAERLWSRVKPLDAPLRIINRDFQRFDLRLEQAPDTREMIAFLVATAGMPEQVARKIPSRTPLFTHHDVRCRDVGSLVETVLDLGGRMSAHLLALQRFQLHLVKVRNASSASRLLVALGGIDSERAREVVRAGATIDHPATVLQARWLQFQLKLIGTDARLLLV